MHTTKGVQRTIAHLLIGRVPEAPLNSGVRPRTLTLTPSSTLYRRSPVSIHPSTAPTVAYPAHWHVIRSLRISHDPVYEDRNLAKTKSTQSNGSDVDMNGILEEGRLMQFVHPSDQISQATIAAIADNFRPVRVEAKATVKKELLHTNTTLVEQVIMLVPTTELPKLSPQKIQYVENRPDIVNFRVAHQSARLYATMVATIEFKHRLPRSPSYSQNTVAMYSHGRFLTDGRGDLTAEIWSAPPGIVGDITATVEEGWRDKMVCLAVTTQMAIAFTAKSHIPTADRPNVKSKL